MFRPPQDPPDRPLIEPLTWRSIMVSYALTGAVPLVLWVVTRPVVGIVAVAGLTGLFVGGRWANRLKRCFNNCQGFTFNVAGKAQITVARMPADEAT